MSQPTSSDKPTPKSLAEFALSFGSGTPTRDQQQQIATHYEGWLPTYDSDDFLVAWQLFEAGPQGNALYSPVLQPGYTPCADALAVALGYMTQSQFNLLPANIGIMRTPADGHPNVPVPAKIPPSQLPVQVIVDGKIVQGQGTVGQQNQKKA